MSELQISYKDSQSYDEQVSIDIRFKAYPDEADRKAIMDAVEVIKNVSEKWMRRSVAPIAVKSPGK